MSDTKTLEQLERENDEALVAYWESVLQVEKCVEELVRTKEWLILAAARLDKEQKTTRMAEARMAYLRAKIGKG